MPRFTLEQIGQELDVYREMGVFFTLSKDEWVVLYECAPRAEACKPQVRDFRDQHDSEIRAFLMTEKETKTRNRLEFARWQAEQGRWGIAPGLRVLRGLPKKRKKASA